MSKPLIPKSHQHQIALERIKQLLAEADEVFSSDKKQANRYVQLARNIAMKVKAKIPVELKRRFCKHCYSYLRPGVNSRIRTRAGKVVISCFECKKFMRIPMKHKKER